MLISVPSLMAISHSLGVLSNNLAMPTRRASSQQSAAVFIGLIAILCVGAFVVSKHLLHSPDNTSSADTTPSPSSSNELPFITQNDAWMRSERDSNITFVDIRPGTEFEQTHIPQSRPLAFDALNSYQPDAGKITVIVYASTQTELLPQAEDILQHSGIEHFFLREPFENWAAAGQPTLSIGNPGSFVDQSKITYLTLDQIKPFLDSHPNALFLDVRSETEFHTSHAPQALNIPLADLEFRFTELPRSTMLLIYGKNTTDAFRAGVRLADLNLYLTRVIDATPSDLEKSGIPFEK